jgi:hypothetical protein
LFDVWCQLFDYASCRGIPANDFRFWGSTSLAIILLVFAAYIVAMKRLA